MKITHTEDHEKLRKNLYPSLEELADAVYWQQKGNNTKMEEWVKKCEDVKKKIPK